MTPTLNFLALFPSDLPASLAFYRRLGLDIPAEADHEVHVDIQFDNGVRLAWDRADVVKEIHPDRTPPSGGFRQGMAFEVGSPSEVDQLYRYMAEAGYGKTEPWDAMWGQRYACLMDPDGNVVDLYAPLTSD
ncbi:VOC family protein [Natronoglycomyces albus]|uniref:VOC family protein n=1 Tax=Natronoglycomyces albus TaxID=2811108 RepID=UPI003CCDF667